MGTSIGPLLLLLSLPVMHAPDLNATMEARTAEVRARAAFEAMAVSMLVTGTIEVDQQGDVERFELDQRDKLPESVDRLFAEAVPAWRFEPTLADGLPVAVRAPMRVRVVATKASEDSDSLLVRVGSASFGASGEGGLRMAESEPPQYPLNLLRMSLGGTVYFLMKVGRTGRVEDVVAEQVNLDVVASERNMRRRRAQLAKSAVSAARDWTFVPPTDGDEVDAPFWVLRGIISFSTDDRPPPDYGEWAAYVPGPRTVPDWAGVDAAAGVDSSQAGQFYPIGRGLKLLTPLGR